MDTDDPLYEIDLTDQEPLAPPERSSSRREALGLLAATIVLAGGAGQFLIRSKGKPPPETLSVELVGSRTEHHSSEQTSDVEHPPLPAAIHAPGAVTSFTTRPPHARQLAIAGPWGAELIDLSNAANPATQPLLPAIAGDFQPRIAFSPNGKTLAACDAEQVVLWDMASKSANLATRRTVPATLPRFAFLADDLLAVAQTGDATIQFWKTARIPTVLQTYTGPVGRSVTLTADPGTATLTVVQSTSDQTTTQILRITRY